MTFDFSKAFQEGINAAEITAKKNAEIDQVISDMNSQIQAATGNVINVFIQGRTNNLAALTSMFATGGNQNVSREYYIVAKNVQTEQQEDLAAWGRAPTAYPCKISYSDQVDYCSDKESLELQLSGLLSHPDTGKKMARLLQPKQIPLDKDTPKS